MFPFRSSFFRIRGSRIAGAFRAALAALVCLALPAAAQDAASPGLLGAEILPGWRNADGSRVAALRVRLEPGWKTYWRAPGEAGIPPRLDFSASTNVASVEPIWPTPLAFDQNGMRSIGYRGEMLLPLVVRPRDPDAPVELRASVDIGVCRDICAPASLTLAAGLSGPGAADAAIAAAMRDTPEERTGLARCSLEKLPDGVRVTATIDAPAAPDEAALFELRTTPMWASQSVGAREGGRFVASSDFVPEDARPFDLDLSDLRITMLSEAGAIQIDGCAPDGRP